MSFKDIVSYSIKMVKNNRQIVQMIVMLMLNPFINYDISQGAERMRSQIQWFIQDRKLFLRGFEDWRE